MTQSRDGADPGATFRVVETLARIDGLLHGLQQLDLPVQVATGLGTDAIHPDRCLTFLHQTTSVQHHIDGVLAKVIPNMHPAGRHDG